MILETIAFIILSIPLIWVSLPSLRHPKSHGFSRFFAFEIILALFVMNANHWFDTPLFGVCQSISWIFLCIAGVLVVWAVVLLRRVGGGLSRPATGDETGGKQQESTSKTEATVTAGKEPTYQSISSTNDQETMTLFEWENTNQIVTSSIFKCIRHPMYSSLLFLAWGIVLKNVTVVTIALDIAATIALYFTAITDEAEMLQRFGQEYQEYLDQTRARFVPFLF